MVGLTLVLALQAQAAFGVQDLSHRFAVAAPPIEGWDDPCRDRGPAGRWVKVSTDGAPAPASVHIESWRGLFDSAQFWDGARLVVARLRDDNKWTGATFDPCRNAWSPIPVAGS